MRYVNYVIPKPLSSTVNTPVGCIIYYAVAIAIIIKYNYNNKHTPRKHPYPAIYSSLLRNTQ